MLEAAGDPVAAEGIGTVKLKMQYVIQMMEWWASIRKEYNSLLENGTWDRVLWRIFHQESG
jgi:hypothetical protein